MFTDIQATNTHTPVWRPSLGPAGPCTTRHGRWGARPHAAGRLGSAAGPQPARLLGIVHLNQLRLKDGVSASCFPFKRTLAVLTGLHSPVVAEMLASKVRRPPTMRDTANREDVAQRKGKPAVNDRTLAPCRDDIRAPWTKQHTASAPFLVPPLTGWADTRTPLPSAGPRGPPPPSCGHRQVAARPLLDAGEARPARGSPRCRSWGPPVCDLPGSPRRRPRERLESERPAVGWQSPPSSANLGLFRLGLPPPAPPPRPPPGHGVCSQP